MTRADEQRLAEREIALRALQQPACELCPRRCGVDRRVGRGFCGQSLEPQLATACRHVGEEPALSGSSGAGTIFVAGCTMRCCFCQNHQISQPPRQRRAWTTQAEVLARRFLELQSAGCHNIEWVSPTQHLPALVAALHLARREGLHLPLVFNCNGFQRPEVLRLLEGIVDVYLPDAKYATDELALALSETDGYVETNRAALLEMWRQVGPLELDPETGLARRGLLIRHLVLPGHLEQTRAVLTWIAHALPEAWVSLMAQYTPAHRAAARPALARRLTRREYHRAVEILDSVGLEHGWVQEYGTDGALLPDFDRAEPFGPERRA